MANPYMFPTVLAMVIVFLISHLYWIAHFCHPMDSFFGSSAATKGLLVSPALLNRGSACECSN